MIINKLTCAALPLFILLISWTPASGATPKIIKVQVTESTMASQVEIVADSPVTYTYYVLSSPPRAVIDIALADPTPVSRQLTVDSPLITGITLDRLEAPPLPLTRMTISLGHDAYLAVRSSPEDKGRLLATLVRKMISTPEPLAKDELDKDPEEAGKKPGVPAIAGPKEDYLAVEQGTSQAAVAEGAALPATVAAPSAPSAPSTPPAPAASVAAVTADVELPKMPAAASPSERKGTTSQSQKPDLKPVVPVVKEAKAPSVTVTETGVILTGLTQTKAPRVFRLSGPNRLVVDVSGGKGASPLKEFPINRFGITKARVGVYPDKVRFVLDAGQSPLPAYRIEKSGSDLRVIFGK